VIYSLPPACTSAVVNGVTYERCGDTWYAPRFHGHRVEYVVVAPPE
jgi:hypothetical protein